MMARLLPMMALFLLAGCLTVVGPDYQRPEFDLPDRFDQSLDHGAGPVEAAPGDRWWAVFQDDQLDALVAEVLDNNLDLAAAIARIEEAQALLSAVDGLDQPTLDGAIDGDAQSVRRSSGNEDIDIGVGAGLLFGWVPDLFGGQERQEQATRAVVGQRMAARDDLERQIIGQTISLYLDFQRTQSQLGLLNQSLELQQQILALVEQRFDVGLAAQFDVSRSEAQLARTRSEIAPLSADLITIRAELTGLLSSFSLPSLTPVSTPFANAADQVAMVEAVPATLLQSRPDVRAAEAVLIAAVAEIGIAEAAFYPRLQIPGAITIAGSGIGTGQVIESFVASIAAAFNIPLFDGGVRAGNLKAAEARSADAMFAYQQSLVEAASEVEIAMAAINAALTRARDLEIAVDASALAFSQAETLYAEGLTDFLDVLAAEATLLDVKQALLDTQYDLATGYVNLNTSLGQTMPARQPGL